MLGEIIVTVSHNVQVTKLPLSIVKGDGLTLLGRDWLEILKLNWREVNMVGHMSCDHLLAQFDELFQEGLTQLKGVTAKLHVDKKITPRFYKAKPVLYAFRSKVSAEIERLEAQGIIEHVTHSDWATSVVPVVKSNGTSIRLCGDYKVTINSVCKTDMYPIVATWMMCLSLHHHRKNIRRN